MMQAGKVPETINNGERMIPDAHGESVAYMEHLLRYLFASQVTKSKRVLDIASGVGYGSELLKRNGAEEVVGVDFVREAVVYGLSRRASGRPDYVLGDAEALPLADSSFDAVISFETIEHLAHPFSMLKEVQRVLRPGGLFIVSTPNKGVFIEGNPFHLHEFTFEELQQALAGAFKNTEYYAQDNWITSGIFTAETAQETDVLLPPSIQFHKASEQSQLGSLYIIGVCSDGQLPDLREQAMLTTRYEMKAFAAQIASLTEESKRLTAEKSSLLEQANQLRLRNTRLQRDLGVRTGELEGALRRVDDIERSIGWRMLNRVRPIVRRAAPHRPKGGTEGTSGSR